VLIFCGGIASANASAALFGTTATQGGKRTASPFLDGFAAREIAQPAILPLPANAPCPTPIAVDWPEDRHVTDRSPRSYENCPRRFFYTHVLGLGGGRKSTAFSRTHDCLYELIQWLSAERLSGDPGEAAAVREFERIWEIRGPTDHAFAADYLRLASRLIAVLVRCGVGRRFRAAQLLAIDLANGRVVVEPDEIAELPNGSIDCAEFELVTSEAMNTTGLNTVFISSQGSVISLAASQLRPFT